MPCSRFNVVDLVSINVMVDIRRPGRYRVMLGHSHREDTRPPVLESFDGLTLHEVQVMVDAHIEAHEPGYRHPWAAAKQASFFD